MPSLGEILCHESFQFSDGARGKKLVVVLNAPDPHDPCIVVKTTSKSKRYSGVQPGCNVNKKVFFLPDNGKEILRGDSYIQLEETFELSCNDMMVSVLKKELSSIGRLSDLTVRQVKNCLKKLRLDISQRHYDLIFK